MDEAGATAGPQGGDLVRRHRLPTRLWHWLNAVTWLIMLMSGLMILNAHPRLYWGAFGADPDRPWLTLVQFPGWMTIPSHYSLADARMWHLAFAWVLAFGLLGFLAWALLGGHIRRDLHITASQWRPSHLWHDVREHARLRFPTGAAALRYNVLQKLAYCGTLFVLLPLVILTGLTLSPGMDAAWPVLLDLFGGRQSARSLHFLAAAGLVLFVVVHLVMVVLAGPLNEVRAMITGWYRLPQGPHVNAISRRGALAAGAGGLLVSACDRINASPGVRALLGTADDLHLPAQRLLAGRDALAREFGPGEMSPLFRTNGNTDPADSAYRSHFASGFAKWALRVDGLVKRPLDLPLAALKALPQRTQITRHDCVEGWSAIGQWQGPQLGTVLAQAGLLPSARYAVFHCADAFGTAPYYESIDLIDAFHPQTILAWRMNGAPLSLGHGAPVRLRVERQLGYKQAKYVMRIELCHRLAGLYGGKGGYWEDASGYQWYAGI